MSQPSVASFFSTRKRAASEELRNKAKVLVLHQEERSTSLNIEKSLAPVPEDASNFSSEESSSPKLLYACKDSDDVGPSCLKANSAVRNIIFDLSKGDSVKTGTPKTPKMPPKTRLRSRKLSTEEGQTDIRETLKKSDSLDGQNVPFEKKGLLSPKKRSAPSNKNVRTAKKGENREGESEPPAAGSVTPKKAPRIDGHSIKELSFIEIKNRINQSSRLAEIKASIDRFKNADEKLTKLQAQNEKKQIHSQRPHIRKFDKIELEIPIR